MVFVGVPGVGFFFLRGIKLVKLGIVCLKPQLKTLSMNKNSSLTSIIIKVTYITSSPIPKS